MPVTQQQPQMERTFFFALVHILAVFAVVVVQQCSAKYHGTIWPYILALSYTLFVMVVRVRRLYAWQFGCTPLLPLSAQHSIS